MAKRKNSLGIAPFDAANYLRTPEEIASYLKVAVKNAKGDPELILRALGVAARARGMSALAKDTGMTRAGIYRAVAQDASPSIQTVARLMDALGLRLSVG